MGDYCYYYPTADVEWQDIAQGIWDQITEGFTTYGQLLDNIPSAQEDHYPLVHRILQALAIPYRFDHNIFDNFQAIYGVRHTIEELDDYFDSTSMLTRPVYPHNPWNETLNYHLVITNLPRGERGAAARQFVQRVVEELAPENVELTRDFLYHIVGLRQPPKHPPQRRFHYPPVPSWSPPRVIPQQIIPAVTNLAFPPPPPQSPVSTRPRIKGTTTKKVGVRRRLLCKEKNKKDGKSCTSIFQGRNDLRRHCREQHELKEGEEYDVAGCGPYSLAKMQKKRPGHKFPPFDQEK